MQEIDVTLGDGLTVVAGVSGLGKSSLVFDTLYHEACWRYLEILSLGSSELRLLPAKVWKITGEVDPSYGLNLIVPGFAVILPLETTRGLIFALTLLPVAMVWRGSRWRLIVWSAVTIAMLAGVTTMLQASMFPFIMRVVHGLEISADSIAHGAVIAALLWLKPANRAEP